MSEGSLDYFYFTAYYYKIKRYNTPLPLLAASLSLSAFTPIVPNGIRSGYPASISKAVDTPEPFW